MDDTKHGLEKEITSLRDTLRALRGKAGCPWDREQTIDDISAYIIEEAYELLRAEKTGNWEEVEEELGDVLFLVVYMSELLSEKMETSLVDILRRVHRKIINRHPHVFGSTSASNSLESTSEWERIKRNEKRKPLPKGILANLPPKLMPLRKALAVQRKAAEVGFDWPDHTGILEKLEEEIEELRKALDSGERVQVKEEIGDLFFTVVNLARRLNVDPENVLEGTTAKFVDRFGRMEKSLDAEGKAIREMNIDELEKYWQKSKNPGRKCASEEQR